MRTFIGNVRVELAVFGVAFGVFASGCEINIPAASTHTDASTPTDAASASETSSTDPAVTNPSSTSTSSAVLNDDPNCEIKIKYQNRNIHNDGQVHYVSHVLTSEPFGEANPVCVQYNDAETGEVTVWKDQSSTGPHVNTLPSDRTIDLIVVWYE